MNRAVIYARYSSSGQTEQSIEGQLRDCYKVAEEAGLTVVKEYIDRALSGKDDARPNFRRMIYDSAFNNFDVVITWKIDRFARNKTDSAIYKKMLRDNDVKLMYAAENIPEGNEGIILESVLEGLAEYYSLDFVQKTIRGKKESIIKGKHASGHVLFGYKLDENKYYEIDEKTAPIIKKIFYDYVKGVSISEIVRTLNNAGLKTKVGQVWTRPKIHHVLKNIKYAGVYEGYGVQSKEIIPCIVDLETFNAAQKKLEENKLIGGKHKAKHKYMLSGKIKCGICGTSMCGKYSITNKRTRAITCYYWCNAKKETRNVTCTSKSIKRDLIENLVLKNTIEIILKDDFIENIASQIVKLNAMEYDAESLIDTYKAELNDIKTKINNIMNAIENGTSSKRMVERIAELEERELQIEQQLLIENSKKRQSELTKEQIIFWLSSFKNGDIKSIEFCENLIKFFINKVVVYPEYCEVHYNYVEEENSKMLFPLNRDTDSFVNIKVTESQTIFIYKNSVYLQIML